MWYANPMQVEEIEGCAARCSVDGLRREVSLVLMEDEPVRVGDFVIVHAGYAIRRVTPEEALAARRFLSDD